MCRPTRLSKNSLLENLHKNLPQQAQKSPKCYSEHKKQGAFQCFCPTFLRSIFGKGLFRQFQRFAFVLSGYRWMGQDSPLKREKLKARKMPKNVRPAHRQLDALLARFAVVGAIL